MRNLLVGLVLILGSAAALADNHLDLGVSYRAGLTYDDDGLNDNAAGDNAKASSSLAAEFARIIAKGKPADKVSYTLWYQVSDNALHRADARLQVTDFLAFSIGRGKTPQGGWDIKHLGHSTITPRNEYANHKPFGLFGNAMAFHMALAGELTFAVTNDVKASSDDDAVVESGHKNESDDSVAILVEWMGNFSGWMPLVQIGTYDLNKSTYFVVGVKGGVAGLGLVLDFIQDTRHYEHRIGGAKQQADGEDVYQAINVDVNYALKGFTPFVEYRSFDLKQADVKKGSDVFRKDADANTSTAAFDDNASSIAVGTTCTALGKGYVPYISWAQKSGTFLKGGADAGDESLSKSVIKVGVHGIF